MEQAEAEQRDYEELTDWLHHADSVLQIVDRPVHDIEAEYKVDILRCQYSKVGLKSVDKCSSYFCDG